MKRKAKSTALTKKAKPSPQSTPKPHPKDSRDHSPYVAQRKKLDWDLYIRNSVPWTANQLAFLELAARKDVSTLIVDGPAGTAKSFLAVYCALKRLQEKRSSDLIYIRSTVQASDGETGFLSGDLHEKMFYFNAPLMDKLGEFLDEKSIDQLMKEERIKTFPTSLIRGNSWNSQDIIFDEAQNAAFASLQTVITRVGQFSKCYILADRNQNDYGNKSGFSRFYNIFDDEESKAHGIHTVRFTTDDIVRSELVRFVVRKIEEASKLVESGEWQPKRT